jgi:hypothetical protein
VPAENGRKTRVKYRDAERRARGGERAHLDFRQTPESLGEQAQHDALAAARIARQQREAAFLELGLLDAAHEVLDGGRGEQALGRHIRRERIPLERKGGEIRIVHDSSSGCFDSFGR